MSTINLTTLTPNAARQSLQNNGLAALGLTTVALGTRWADVTPQSADYDDNALTLNISGVLRTPFLGWRHNIFQEVESKLAGALPADATTLSVTAGQGNLFPSPLAPGRMLLTLSNSAGDKTEIIECTSRAGDVLAIVRGALGSAKQSFQANDRVCLRLSSLDRASEFYEVSGHPIAAHGTALRFHPQAYLRLQTICTGRYAAAGQPLTLPLPVCMVVRGAEGFRAPRWYRPDEILEDVSGQLSFHDARGQIIDPLYVAALFADLQSAGALPGLVPPTVTAAANGVGGVQSIAGIVPGGSRLHLVDLHGNSPRLTTPGFGLITDDGSGVSTGDINGSLVTLAPGNRLASNVNSSTNPTPLRFGFATNGILSANPLAPPPLAAGTLAHRFYRVIVVDQNWHLLGNRTASTVQGIGPDDARIPATLLPVVRDQVDINYFTDGPDTLAEATRILSQPNQGMLVAVSPSIETLLLTPAAVGAAAHWPQFPAVLPPNIAASFPVPPVALTAANVTAAFTANKDVVVTLSPGSVPSEASVRIYPQRFVEISSINVSEPSMVRGDGGAGVAGGNGAVSVVLPNPFQLGPAQPVPNPAGLTMDIVVTPRVGRRRLTTVVDVPVAQGSAARPSDPFLATPGTTLMSVLPVVLQGVCDSPLFDIPNTVSPPAAAPANLLQLVLSLAAEPSPRKSPRLPTMARFETIVAVGTTDPVAQPPGSLLWQAVLTGGRWTRESRSAQHAEGNPGNPAAPDIHASSVSVTGALAYDLALHALKRAQPLIPLPTSAAGTNPGWLVSSAGDNFDPPSDTANVANTSAGVLLETVAVGCETPWLGLLTPPPAGNTLNQMIANAATAMGVPPPSVTFTINNEPRLQREVRREFFAAQQGFRDAQWSLRRAIGEARELVYIESPQVARTARPSGAAQAFEVDLIAELAARLAAFPNLKVLLCTPRESDFAENFKSFRRQHYAARLEALSNLQAVARDRVLLFHPIGFPGRPAFVRTTSIVVDDVWCMIGATHVRRRGMTFDGSAAIASYDRQITNGYSTKVRNYRRALMAAKLNVPVPLSPIQATGEWVRLGSPVGAFSVVGDMLRQGGLGRIQDIWPGPPASDTSVLPAQPDVADPDGSQGSNLFTTLAGMLNEAGT